MFLSLIMAFTLVTPSQKICPVCHHKYIVGQELSREYTYQLVGLTASRSGSRLSRSSKKAILAIIEKESHYKPTSKNRRSSAYGLMGFLAKTWKPTGIYKTACPSCQIRAGLIYIRQRYHTPEKALRFHNTNGYY